MDYLHISALFLFVLTSTIRGQGCGGFIQLTKSTDYGYLISPQYPNHYPNNTHCIWFIEAPKEYGINLTVHTVQGQMTKVGKCIDRLSIRNGSKVEKLLAEYCITNQEQVIRSRTRWLWVEFWTDGEVTNKGFSATFEVMPLPGSGLFTTPAVQCQSMNFKCANKECISWAYHCDAMNDCGCMGKGCDEYGCLGFNWSTTSRLVLGGFLGVIVFVLVFVGIGCFDILWKEHTESEFQRQMDQAKKQARQKRNKPPPQEIINQATGGGASGTGLSSPGSVVASISSPGGLGSNAAAATTTATAATAAAGGGAVVAGAGEAGVKGQSVDPVNSSVSITMTTADKSAANEPCATPTSKRSITPSVGAKSTDTTLPVV